MPVGGAERPRLGGAHFLDHADDGERFLDHHVPVALGAVELLDLCAFAVSWYECQVERDGGPVFLVDRPCVDGGLDVVALPSPRFSWRGCLPVPDLFAVEEVDVSSHGCASCAYRLPVNFHTERCLNFPGGGVGGGQAASDLVEPLDTACCQHFHARIQVFDEMGVLMQGGPKFCEDRRLIVQHFDYTTFACVVAAHFAMPEVSFDEVVDAGPDLGAGRRRVEVFANVV